jgi:hypothetical protein
MLCNLIALPLLGVSLSVLPQKQTTEGWRNEVLKTLAKAHLQEKDLGYRPKSWWTAFPRMEQTPFLLPHFRELFANPLDLPFFTRGFGKAIERFLPPQAPLPKTASGGRLRRLLYYLAVDRMVTGFRTYSANLDPRPRKKDPLFHALLLVQRAGGQPTRLISFGKEADYPNLRKQLQQDLKDLPLSLHLPLAEFILNSLDARTWAKKALRNVPKHLSQKIETLSNLGETQGDGNGFFPELEDTWKHLDFHSLAYSGFKACDALEKAEADLLLALEKLDPKQKETLMTFRFRWISPLGPIVIAGTGEDNHRERRPFLAVDLGGNDHWLAPVATANANNPLSLLLDLGGNDTYISDKNDGPSQGVGILGVGVLMDSAGDDVYKIDSTGQGFGQLGIGILADRRGKDRYEAHYSAQGAGILGIGLCLDGSGDDKYRLFADGQGMGLLGGVGVLGDAGGNDDYFAEPSAKKTGRGDYHSKGGVSVSFAQGAGGGRRGDGSDGHSYAGGLGALLDLSGNDHYKAGNFSLGIGYWFGTGLVWDGGGNDVYESCYFTQASGAHFAIGVIVDEAGDDTHRLVGTSGAGIAFGWDLVNALLLDVKGNDSYEAKIISLGSAEVRSNAFLIDLEGNDIYRLGIKAAPIGLGGVDTRKEYGTVRFFAPYNGLVSQIGLFLDLGGKDQYVKFKPNGSPFLKRKNGVFLQGGDPKTHNFALFDDR